MVVTSIEKELYGLDVSLKVIRVLPWIGLRIERLLDTREMMKAKS